MKISLFILALLILPVHSEDQFQHIKTFKIFTQGGSIIYYDKDAKPCDDKKFEDGTGTISPNGELIITIIDKNTARIIGDLGAGDLAKIDRSNSITFIELPQLGIPQVLTVYDIWDAKHHGYSCIYRRAADLPFAGPCSVSTYYGGAVPFD